MHALETKWSMKQKIIWKVVIFRVKVCMKIDQGGPKANIENFKNNSLLNKYHSNELQSDDKRLPNNGSVKIVTKSMLI